MRVKNLISAACLVLLFAAHDAQAQGVQNVDQFATLTNSLMADYYKAPANTNVPGLLKTFELSAASRINDSYPPVIGFMAGLFIKYPDQISAFIPEKPSPLIQNIIAAGLGLAGHPSEIKRYGALWGWSDATIAQRSEGPALLAMPANSATDFDLNWGASYATGEGRFVRKIVDAYARTAERKDIDVEDIVKLTIAIDNPSDTATIQKVLGKYSQQDKLSVVLASTALKFLKANARQHGFVATTLQQVEVENPTSKAMTGWRAYMAQ